MRILVYVHTHGVRELLPEETDASIPNGRTEILHGTSWVACARVARERRPHVLVLEDRLLLKSASDSGLEAFQRRFPWVPVAVLETGGAPPRRLLAELARVRVDALLTLKEASSAVRLGRAVEHLRGSGPPLRVAAELAAAFDLPDDLHRAVRFAIAEAPSRPGREELARAVHLSVSQLNRRLKAGGLPSAARLLVWGRLMRAELLMTEGGDLSDLVVAHSLGYDSRASMAVQLRRYASCSPGDLRNGNGRRRVLEAFQETVRGQRRSAGNGRVRSARP